MRQNYVECTYSLAVLIMSLLSDMYPWLSLTLTLTIISLFFTRQLLAPESKQQNCQHLHVPLVLILEQMLNMKQSIPVEESCYFKPVLFEGVQGRWGHNGTIITFYGTAKKLICSFLYFQRQNILHYYDYPMQQE